MIPPQAKQLVQCLVKRYASDLKLFKSSNPVIMLGQLKLDRIDQKVNKQASKICQRQMNKNVKLEGIKKKYQKRKAAITYRSYTVQFKRKLIQRIKELNQRSNVGLSKIIRAKARQLNIHPKNIFRWFNTKQIKKKQGGRKARYPQMEQRLAKFIINNPKMKRKHILRQAKQIMQDLRIPGREHFNFSKGWYERFRERLVKRKVLPEKIETKGESKMQQSYSDFDETKQLIKKEEYDGKIEQSTDVKNQEVKLQYDQYGSESDFDQNQWQDVKIEYDSEMEDEQQVKYEYKDQNTHMNGDVFILNFDQIMEFKKQQNRGKNQDLKAEQLFEGMLKTQKFEEKSEQVQEFSGSYTLTIDLSNGNISNSQKIEVSVFDSNDQV